MPPAVHEHPEGVAPIQLENRDMSILSPPSILDNPDPPSQADHEALNALVGVQPADRFSPADYLSRDWIGAILADRDDGFTPSDSLPLDD